MKAEVLQSLLVSKTLYDEARVLLYSDNKYSTSAALVILQDAFELVMKAALIEREVDEVKSFEKASFDDLIALLRDNGVPVKKSGTLKAMNKARVIVKHYGQLAEQASVKTYFDATEIAANSILQEVFGKSLSEIYPSEIIADAVVRSFLLDAEKQLAGENIFAALLDIRMALFMTIEKDYDIAAWASHGSADDWLLFLGRGASAPYHTRNAEWIAQNVHEPFDYIQLNHEKIKIDLMEWGVNTQDFWNIWRLTPKVYKAENSEDWNYSSFELENDVKTELENAKYCLDRTINLVLKKQQHASITRIRPYVLPRREILVTTDTPRLTRARADAPFIVTAKVGEKLVFGKWITGFDGRLYYVIEPDYLAKEWITHYIDAEHCEVC